MAVAEQDRQSAFRESAVAASKALHSGATLQELASANQEVSADLLASTPTGTLYTSVASLSYHALTGDLLSKPALDPHTVVPN
jgi:hypothetical protein